MKIFIFMLAVVLLGSAAAEESASAVIGGAQVLAQDEIGMYSLYTVEYPSGEQAVVTMDAQSGNIISVITSVAAQPVAAQLQERAEAENVVLAEYPDALILFGEDGEDGAKILYVIAPELGGVVHVRGGMICRRILEYGLYFKDGKLTMDGAVLAMSMHRPEADIRALELDEDDGIWCYEGEAYINGIEYEFEINASSGRMLEWERD